ncbi:DUF6443 domain-containing protein [Chryseobacterium flavum]
MTLLGLTILGIAKAQTLTENYIRSQTCLSSDCIKKTETLTYYDGLGRPKQVVNVKATPTGKDFVTPVVYDVFGRQAKEILPTPVNTLNGGIHTGIINENNANIYYGVTNAFSETQFESSPLGRIERLAHPGEPWKMTGGKVLQYSYSFNVQNEVKKFIATSSLSNGSTISTLKLSTENTAYASGGVYKPGTLYKTIATDEDGNPVTEFKNGSGQTLLIRKTDGSQNLDTYYVYNEYDQLAFIVPPKAVKNILTSLIVTPEIVDEFCFQYRYDGKDRQVEKKIPGKGWEHMVYNKADQLVMSRDAVLSQQGKWLFTKYDEFGRVAYTGISNNAASRQTVQNSIDANTNLFEKRSTTAFTNSGMAVYYTNLSGPTTVTHVLTVNYYDTYPSGAPAVPAEVLGQKTMTATVGTDPFYTKGLQTASYVKNIEDDSWTKTFSYYDTKGRLIASKLTNHLGGYTNRDIKLDFTGLIEENYTYHKRTSADTETKIKETFVYDSQNRLVKQYHQVNSLAEELLSDNTYNDLGQLINKKTGNTTGTPLQSIDYTYNIRGWLTSINNPNKAGGFTGKLFGLELKYDNPVNAFAGAAKFNGNISQADWKTANDGVLRRYTYEYDKINRLVHGAYSKPGATVENTMAYTEWLMYDENGNIVHIDRYGGSDGNQPEMIDELEYTYNGNRLINISDNTFNPSGYPVGGQNIGYDLNGNMTDHKDRKINSISYNHLNLPVTVNMVQGSGIGTSRNGNIIDFKYMANGNKVEKITDYVNPYTTDLTYTDYLGEFQYERTYVKSNTATNPSDSGYLLQFFPTSEGYYDFQKKRYIYNYVDQVGNVRLSYYKNASGAAVIDKETNYYPFGLEHMGYNGGLSQLQTYRYGFQNQERQSETGWSSFKWRNYDPAMARFFNVDPLSEKYGYQSPYNFSENRVVDGRELEGLEWIPIPIYRGGAAVPPPPHGGGSGIYEQAKSNAINNYNGLLRVIGTQINVAATVGSTGLVIAKSVLNSEGNSKAENKGSDTNNKNNNEGLSNIPKPGKGKGTVDKKDRDPKRTLSEKDKKKLIEEKDGKCEGCGKEVDSKTSDAHHTKRHADGGETTKDNTNILCKDCHKEIHR